MNRMEMFDDLWNGYYRLLNYLRQNRFNIKLDACEIVEMANVQGSRLRLKNLSIEMYPQTALLIEPVLLPQPGNWGL